LDQAAFGELAHADSGHLGGRNPQGHLILDEIDDEQLELGARYLLFLDRHDLADAVRRIDDIFVGLEALPLGGLLGGHYRNCSLFRLAAGCLGHGGCTSGGCAACSLRCPPDGASGWFFGAPARAGRTLLGFLTHLPCHKLMRALCTPLHGFMWVSWSRKIMLPTGSLGRKSIMS